MITNVHKQKSKKVLTVRWAFPMTVVPQLSHDWAYLLGSIKPHPKTSMSFWFYLCSICASCICICICAATHLYYPHPKTSMPFWFYISAAFAPSWLSVTFIIIKTIIISIITIIMIIAAFAPELAFSNFCRQACSVASANPIHQTDGQNLKYIYI